MVKPTLSYMICCVPRTGSWLLAETLQSIGTAGRPREYLDPATQHKYLRLWGMSSNASFSQYLDRIKLEATTPNGVFGIKVHWYQFEDFLHKLSDVPALRAVPTAQQLPAVFPDLRYIFLSRRDKLRHAVSYARASETKLWWEVDPLMGPTRCVLARTPKFNVARLDRMLYKIHDHERQWRQYFQQHHMVPLTVYYEDLARDYAGETRRVLDYLGIPAPAGVTIDKPRLRKQADNLSELWVTRYRAITRRRQAAVSLRSAAS